MQHQTFVLDGLNFTDLVGLTEEVATLFCIDSGWLEGHYEGPWRGNLDVLHDMLYWPVEDRSQRPSTLTGERYVLEWRHAAVSQARLGHPARAVWLRSILPNFRATPGRGRVVQWIEEADSRTGPTLFDQVVRLIERKEFIELRLNWDTEPRAA